MVREGAEREAEDVLRVSGVEMRVNGSSNKYGALRCELLYGVVNSGSSFRTRRTLGAGSTENGLQLPKREERRGGVVFCMFSTGSKKWWASSPNILFYISGLPEAHSKQA